METAKIVDRVAKSLVAATEIIAFREAQKSNSGLDKDHHKYSKYATVYVRFDGHRYIVEADYHNQTVMSGDESEETTLANADTIDQLQSQVGSIEKRAKNWFTKHGLIPKHGWIRRGSSRRMSLKKIIDDYAASKNVSDTFDDADGVPVVKVTSRRITNAVYDVTYELRGQTDNLHKIGSMPYVGKLGRVIDVRYGPADKVTLVVRSGSEHAADDTFSEFIWSFGIEEK